MYRIRHNGYTIDIPATYQLDDSEGDIQKECGLDIVHVMTVVVSQDALQNVYE